MQKLINDDGIEIEKDNIANVPGLLSNDQTCWWGSLAGQL